MEFEELAALAVLLGFFGRGEFAFGEGDARFLRDGANRLGETDVLDFLDEGEDVAVLVAAEAIEELAAGVNAEGRSLLFMEGAEAGVVLGASFAESDVVANDLDDVGLLFDGLGEVVGHGVPDLGYSGGGGGKVVRGQGRGSGCTQVGVLDVDQRHLMKQFGDFHI